jgi:DNA-binding LacI/PurR family transcriptional regulator
LPGLLDAGKTCDERLVIRGGFGEADGAVGLRSLLQHDQPPQAIFAVTYPVALGVLQAAVERGLRVPQDLDLIAFGGSSYNRFVSLR